MDHLAEAARYTLLANEAENQTTSANTPEYYRSMADKHSLMAKIKVETFLIGKDIEYIDIQTYVSDGSGPEYVANISKDIETGNIAVIWGYSPDDIEAFDEISTENVPALFIDALNENMPTVMEMFLTA